jgi:hypothetical protein
MVGSGRRRRSECTTGISNEHDQDRVDRQDPADLASL